MLIEKLYCFEFSHFSWSK